MPTYEYLCQTCRHRFETWQKMTDEPLTTCPECGSPIHRVLYPTGVIFKGSGFYKTDHRSNGSSSSTNNETSKSESATETKSTSTTESSKPASSESTTASASAS